MRYNITALFFCIDEFCKAFEEWEKHRLIDTGRKRHRSCDMSLSEMLTIMVLFHVSPCKVFKYFYVIYLKQVHGKEFPNLISYNRFVQLMPRLFVPLCVLLQNLFGEETGIYIADPSALPVCHNKRINRNRVFKGLAARGKTTMGWFYGLKLHLVINHKGSIVAVFLGSLVEGESVIFAAGFLAHEGYLSLPKIILVSFTGTLIADQVLYQIGRYYGGHLLDRFPSLKPKADRVFYLLKRYDTLFILTFRFIYGIRTLSPLIIGASGVGIKRYSFLNFVAALIWSVGSCVAAYYLAHLIMEHLHFFF